MPRVTVTIGGRSFDVSCQAGEEPFLRAAAGLLNTEAEALTAQAGRMAEGKMLLMAGLMLADRTAGLEQRLAEAEGTAPVEVPVVPRDIHDRLAELTAQAESIAEEVDAKL